MNLSEIIKKSTFKTSRYLLSLAIALLFILLSVNNSYASIIIPPGGSTNSVALFADFNQKYVLPSPRDNIGATLTVVNTSNDEVQFSGELGLRFYTVGGNADGSQAYFTNPNPVQSGSWTIPVGGSIDFTFSTGITNGGCLSGNVNLRTVPYFMATVSSSSSDDATTSGGIGASMYGNVFKSDGNWASGATVNFLSSGGVSRSTQTSSTGFYEFRNLNCSHNHTMSVNFQGESGSRFIPGVNTPGDTNPNGICNGEERGPFIINLQAAATPIPPTPTPIPPTPTPAPSVSAANLACDTVGTPTLDASWIGNSQNSCNVYIRAGATDNPISTACNGSWNGTSLVNSGAVIAGGTYQLNASDGVNNRQSTVTCPAAPTPTLTPTPTPSVCPVNGTCCQSPLTSCTSNAQCTTPGYNWCYAGYCISNNYDPASNTCAVPTPTPTPIPGAISVLGNPVCVGTDSQINWSWSGGKAYKKLTLFNDTLGASQDFTPSSNQTTFTSSGLPYNNRFRLKVTDASGRSGTSVPAEVSKTCVGPTPTPTTGTPTPTPGGQTCEPPPDYSCTTSLGSGCTTSSITQQQHAWCRQITGTSASICQYCQPPTPPQTTSCPRIEPPNNAPTLTLRPDGKTLEITYNYSLPSSGGGDNSLLPFPLIREIFAQASVPRVFGDIYRGSSLGFLPGGEEVAWAPGNSGIAVDANASSDIEQTYYYQAQALGQNITSLPSNTFGVVVPKRDKRQCRPPLYRSVPGITDAVQMASNVPAFNFELTYTVSATDCGNRQNCVPSHEPAYLKITRSSGKFAILPWQRGFGWCTRWNFWWPGNCTQSTYKTLYGIGLPPGTRDSFTVSGFEGAGQCSWEAGGGSATFSAGTGDGFFPPPVSPTNLSARVYQTGDSINRVLVNWSGQRDGQETRAYRSQTRWTGGTQLATTRNYDGSWTFTATDDLTNLPSGTYYYGVRLDLGNRGIVPPSCQNRNQQTDQASFTWAALPRITGNVYVDTNGNGVKDLNEQPYQGATINFSGASTGSKTTDALGNYTFFGTTGSYTVTLGTIAGYAPSTTNPVSGVNLPPDKIVNFGIQPLYSIAGTVFVDDSQDQLKNGAEQGYTGASTVTFTNTSSGQKTQTTTANGVYTSGTTLLAGSYTVSYTTLPSGYRLTYPLNGPPPSILVTVGTGCVNGTSPNTTTCSNGNASIVNFGIVISNPWIQGKGADMRVDSGFTNLLPSNFYTILQGDGSTPGVAFTGDTNADFGKGQASINQFNWLVGGSITTKHPEVFSPKTPGVARTSYNYALATIKQTAALSIDMSTACALTNCTLPANLAEGVYQALSTVDLNTYTFPAGKNFVFLINGNLNIKGDIKVPIGSTATFIVSGSIIVTSGVGVNIPSSSTSNIEGFYSADNSFAIQTATSSTKCNTDGSPIDKRLNIAGSVVANAKLAGGRFDNRRDLCSQNGTYPTVYIAERADMLLNAPSFIKHPNFVWQEVAP